METSWLHLHFGQIHPLVASLDAHHNLEKSVSLQPRTVPAGIWSCPSLRLGTGNTGVGVGYEFLPQASSRLHPPGSVPIPWGPNFNFLGVTDHKSSFRGWHGLAHDNTAAAPFGVGGHSMGSPGQDRPAQCLHGCQTPQGKAKPRRQAAHAGVPRERRGGVGWGETDSGREKWMMEVLNAFRSGGREAAWGDRPSVCTNMRDYLLNTYCVLAWPVQCQRLSLLAVGFLSYTDQERGLWHWSDPSWGLILISESRLRMTPPKIWEEEVHAVHRGFFAAKKSGSHSHEAGCQAPWFMHLANIVAGALDPIGPAVSFRWQLYCCNPFNNLKLYKH